MLDWIHLPLVLGSVTLVIALYALVTRSAGIYSTPRQFWRSLLLSIGISYLLSGSLFLFLHLAPVVAVGIAAIVPFLIGNLDLGEKAREPAPGDEGREEGEQIAEDEEETPGDDYDELTISNPGEMGPFWN